MHKPTTHPGRVSLALIVAPFIGCAAGLISYLQFTGERIGVSDTLELLAASGWVWFYTLPISFILGGVVHFLLLKLRFWPVTAYALAGLLLGPLALIVWLYAISGEIEFDNSIALLGAVTGGITALSFRIMVHKTSDTPSTPPAGTRP